MGANAPIAAILHLQANQGLVITVVQHVMIGKASKVQSVLSSKGSQA